MSRRSPKNVMIGDRSLEEILIRHHEYLDAIKSIELYGYETAPDIINKLKKVENKFKDLPLVYGRLNKKCRYRMLSLHGLDLHNVDLHDADLRGIIFSNTNLDKANLSGVDLEGAIFSFVSLNHINLKNAHMKCTYMHRVESTCGKLNNVIMSYCYINESRFYECDFHSSIITNSSIQYSSLDQCNCNKVDFSSTGFDNSFIATSSFVRANLFEAYLENIFDSGGFEHICSEAINVPHIPLACPSEGEFIGWKKIVHGKDFYLVKLLIPKDARRSSAFGSKCRCSRAKVLGIYDNSGNPTEIKSITNITKIPFTEYTVGENVYPDTFDKNRWEECTHGIHFFIDKEEAMNY